MGESEGFITSPAVRRLAAARRLADIRRERDVLDLLVEQSGLGLPDPEGRTPRRRLRAAVDCLVRSEIGRVLESELDREPDSARQRLGALAAVGHLRGSATLRWPINTVMARALALPIHRQIDGSVDDLMATVRACFDSPLGAFDTHAVDLALKAIVADTAADRADAARLRMNVELAVPDVLREQLRAVQAAHFQRCGLLDSLATDSRSRPFARLNNSRSFLAYELFEEQLCAVSDGVVAAVAARTPGHSLGRSIA